MATQPTNLPVPGESARDLKFNAGKIDEFVTSASHEYIDRFGGRHRTIAGINYESNQAMSNYGYITQKSFEMGSTLNTPNTVLQWESNGEFYRWDGDWSQPKVVPAGSTPDSTGGIGAGAWVSVGDAVIRSDVNNFVWHNSIDLVIAKMASGDAVSIVCYGDSTTDGNGTSGWTQNPIDNSGNAIGNIDHNINSPNSWPVVLESILRGMYKNNNISVHNAGYSGKRMDNGWAVSNYDAAVANNPHYGNGDLTIIDFGLNDIQAGVSVLNNHILQTEVIVEKLLRIGSLPILISSGPEFRDTDDGGLRDNEQISQQINVAKKTICKKYKIPFIDKAKAMKLWLENGASGSDWMSAQPDALHFGDLGHRFQAAFIASRLYGDIIEVDRGGVQNIPFMDSRSNSPAGSVQIYKAQKTKFGANPLFQNPFVSSNLGLSVMQCWVWCNTDESGVIYNSIDNDYQSVYSPEFNSKIKVTDVTLNKLIHNLPSPNVGPAINVSGAFRGADVPISICNLGYGLNLVECVLPSSLSVMEASTYFHGWFSFIDAANTVKKGGLSNLLRDTGDIYYRSSSFDGDYFVLPAPKPSNMSNVVSVVNGMITSLLIEMDLSKGYGMGILAGNVGVSSALPVHIDAGLMIYQTSSTRATLYNYHLNSNGTIGYSDALGYFDRAEGNGFLRLDFSKGSGGEITMVIYSDWEASAALLSLAMEPGAPMKFQPGGRVGAVFINKAEMTSSGKAHLKKATLLRW
ncbi:tail fiber/spike domain-containing protein [Hafnia alvei]|uniref:tail fiber/spike domain-containing protein n=1 Tax=Hafnia alvei TaxID=569 RepID=UPI0040453FF7